MNIFKNFEKKFCYFYNQFKKGQNKSAIKELKELDLFIRKYHNLDTEDNIIFIICYGDKSHEIHNSFESKSSFIQLFHINRLQLILLNII